jgi:hypothetical protein
MRRTLPRRYRQSSFQTLPAAALLSLLFSLTTVRRHAVRLAPTTLLIPLPIHRHIRRRRKLAPCTNALALIEEDEWHRDHDRGNAPDQRHAPVDADALEHVECEEGKDGAEDAAQEGVAGDGGGGEHEVRVDDVVEELQEDGEDAEAGGKSGHGGHDPVDVLGVARPAEPEDACES